MERWFSPTVHRHAWMPTKSGLELLKKRHVCTADFTPFGYLVNFIDKNNPGLLCRRHGLTFEVFQVNQFGGFLFGQ